MHTNIGSIVAELIVLSESMKCITEALNILKKWNPDWIPSFFYCDFSDAEFAAINEAIPNTSEYDCDFHGEQAWTRWVHDR